MSEILKFATAVVYADDVPATVAFYRRVTGLEPTYYDADLGFALLGEDQAVAIASHEAGMLMLANGYGQARSNRVRGTELAFWTRDVAAAFQVAVEAGATALTPPATPLSDPVSSRDSRAPRPGSPAPWTTGDQTAGSGDRLRRGGTPPPPG